MVLEECAVEAHLAISPTHRPRTLSLACVHDACTEDGHVASLRHDRGEVAADLAIGAASPLLIMTRNRTGIIGIGDAGPNRTSLACACAGAIVLHTEHVRNAEGAWPSRASQRSGLATRVVGKAGGSRVVARCPANEHPKLLRRCIITVGTKLQAMLPMHLAETCRNIGWLPNEAGGCSEVRASLRRATDGGPVESSFCLANAHVWADCRCLVAVSACSLAHLASRLAPAIRTIYARAGRQSPGALPRLASGRLALQRRGVAFQVRGRSLETQGAPRRATLIMLHRFAIQHAIVLDARRPQCIKNVALLASARRGTSLKGSVGAAADGLWSTFEPIDTPCRAIFASHLAKASACVHTQANRQASCASPFHTWLRASLESGGTCASVHKHCRRVAFTDWTHNPARLTRRLAIAPADVVWAVCRQAFAGALVVLTSDDAVLWEEGPLVALVRLRTAHKGPEALHRAFLPTPSRLASARIDAWTKGDAGGAQRPQGRR
mmetsp:Transcript_4628/g.17381  ORF Transcript_4628/g.17381 Transcript_4628/m.17381 type:complete len:495 (-) Transcript_4628:5067-6551(-)